MDWIWGMWRENYQRRHLYFLAYAFEWTAVLFIKIKNMRKPSALRRWEDHELDSGYMSLRSPELSRRWQVGHLIFSSRARWRDLGQRYEGGSLLEAIGMNEIFQGERTEWEAEGLWLTDTLRTLVLKDRHRRVNLQGKGETCKGKGKAHVVNEWKHEN